MALSAPERISSYTGVEEPGRPRLSLVVPFHNVEEFLDECLASLAAQTMPPYSVAKGGVITFTRVIAKELAPYGITVNAICPGVLWTAFWEKLAQFIADTNPAFKGMTARQVFDKRVGDVIPMKREQTPEDIGHAAVFLASEEARNITGQALNVDGGSVMH